MDVWSLLDKFTAPKAQAYYQTRATRTPGVTISGEDMPAGANAYYQAGQGKIAPWVDSASWLSPDERQSLKNSSYGSGAGVMVTKPTAEPETMRHEMLHDLFVRSGMVPKYTDRLNMLIAPDTWGITRQQYAGKEGGPDSWGGLADVVAAEGPAKELMSWQQSNPKLVKELVQMFLDNNKPDEMMQFLRLLSPKQKDLK